MTEQEAIEKIHSVYPTGCKNGLENMRALMAKLGNPQERLTMVHVAGTNGKGSCCAMTERVLRAAGYKTGLYTSPYAKKRACMSPSSSWARRLPSAALKKKKSMSR